MRNDLQFQNENGFSVVALLALMPLIVMLLTALAASALLLGTDAELKQDCRATLLRGQDEIASALNSLLALNPQAKALRSARAATEAALLVAADPASQVTLQTKLVEIKAEQVALAMKQRMLIMQAKRLSRSTPEAAKSRLLTTTRRRSNVAGAESTSPLHSNVHVAAFHVVATPSSSETPDYNPSANFSIEQHMSVTAEWPLAAILPAWLRNILGDVGLTLKTSCEATINKGDSGWQSQLQADRS